MGSRNNYASDKYFLRNKPPKLHLFDGNLNSDSPYKPRTPAVAFALIYPKFSGPDLFPLSQPSFSALTACLVTRAFLAAKGVFQNFFPL